MVEPSIVAPASLSGLQIEIGKLEQRIAALEENRERAAGPAPRRRQLRAPPEPHAELETLLGLTWFNRVGAVIVVIGLALAALPLSLLSGLWLGAGAWLSRERRGRTAVGWCYNLSGLVAAVTVLLALRAAGMAWPTLSLWSTVVTTALALTLVAVGVGGGHSASRMLGLGLLAAALVKLLVLDLWTLGAGTRVGVLLALGVGLLAASFLYSRYTDRRSRADEAVVRDQLPGSRPARRRAWR